MPVPISIELLEVGLGLLVLGLISGAWLSGRTRSFPFGFWPLAWAVLVATGAMRVAALPIHFEYGATAAFWALMIAGAYRYAARPIPRGWLVGSASLVAGVVGLSAVGATGVAGWGAVGIAWGGATVSATVVHRAAKAREASLFHRALPVGFFVVAGLGTIDHAFMSHGLDSLAPWLIVGILVATHQAIAVFDSIRLRAKEISEELEQSVSVLTSTLEATGEGILVVDNDGRYTRFNRAFGELWRIPQEIVEQRESEVALTYVRDQLKDPEQFYATVKRLYADREAESYDTLDFKDGRVFERYSRPQRIGDEIVGRVWSFRDVTERKRAEEATERYRDHLEDLVEERTRELIKSRDKLRQADRLVAIGTLAAGVAHQINNPVGAILSASEFALMCEDDGDALAVFKHALEQNVDEARRCGAIVRSMLQFSRQEPVGKTLEDLNQAVRVAVRAVEAYASDRDTRIDLELASRPIEIRMSPLEMEQVVVNLVRNGVEAAGASGRVLVRTRRDEAFARIEIEDDGPGIGEDDRELIFDPFFSTRVAEGGTGLGLSVAHGIVSDHGGHIDLATSPLGGAKFTIVLPIESPEGGRADVDRAGGRAESQD